VLIAIHEVRDPQRAEGLGLPVLLLAGPTRVGKSDSAIGLAQDWGL
jgi:hypothetical protein